MSTANHKSCVRCGLLCLVPDDFYAKGKDSTCKKCRSVLNREYSHRPDRMEFDRVRQRNRARTPEVRALRKEYSKIYRKTEARKRTVQNWKIANLEKVRAAAAVNHALRSGKMQRLSCEVCGNPKTEAHHPDYSKRLEVRWLCKVHHEHEHHFARKEA